MADAVGEGARREVEIARGISDGKGFVLGETADLMTKQLRGDRRVREATYRVEADIAIRGVVTERPFVYAVPQ